jgi:hypothetical protein
MSDANKMKGTETRSAVMLRRFLYKLDRVKRRKSLSEGQTPNSVAARLRRHLSGRAPRQPTGS